MTREQIAGLVVGGPIALLFAAEALASVTAEPLWALFLGLLVAAPSVAAGAAVLHTRHTRGRLHRHEH